MVQSKNRITMRIHPRVVAPEELDPSSRRCATIQYMIEHDVPLTLDNYLRCAYHGSDGPTGPREVACLPPVMQQLWWSQWEAN